MLNTCQQSVEESLHVSRLRFKFRSWNTPSRSKMTDNCFHRNLTRKIYLSFVWSRVLFLSSFTVVVDLSKSMTCLHFHSFIYSRYLVSKMFPYKSITLNHSLSDLIISSQRLVTMSVSLRTQTILCCLIIQVLNMKSLLPKCLTHFCT